MIRLAINGAAGRMGRMVIALARDNEDFEVTSAIERDGHADISKDCGTIARVGELGVPIGISAGDFDVMIDFSGPAGLLSALTICVEREKSLVTGTTGIGEEHRNAMLDASGKIGVFAASNFSKGIAALLKTCRELAVSFPGADVEIVEAHHRMKSDAPSGTALSIGKAIASARGHNFDEVALFERRGQIGPRTAKKIGFSSVRGGGIVGDHKVLFALPYETLIIEHRAVSRELFASGAMDAAKFIQGKTGLFGMNDLITS